MYDFLPVLILRFFFEFDKHPKKAGGHIGQNVLLMLFTKNKWFTKHNAIY